MADTAQPLSPEVQADMLLTESVSVPEFTRKLAADYGLNPTVENHVDLRVLSDRVARTVDTYLQKRASRQESTRNDQVKASIDAAFAVAGTRSPSQRTAPIAANLSAEYFKLAGVQDAAALLTGSAMPPAEAMSEEEEAEAKKLMTPAVA